MTVLASPALRPTFEVTVVRADATRAVLQAYGVLDVAAAERLSAVVLGQLAAGRRFVRLDVSGLRMPDRAALMTLVRAHKTFLDARGTLILTGVGPQLAHLLRRTDLDRTLLVADPY